ncbi:MAG: NAD(P)-binding domain-containing protein [Gemmatimonadaceae bacterium]
MESIGFIGLGKMGRPMATNLARNGSHLVVYDVNPTPVQDLASIGAMAAASIADVATQSSVVFTMLPDSPIVERVIAGADGLLAHMKRGSIIVDMSTIDPRVTDRLASAAAERDIGFVDAPVGRLASHAARGESLFMVGASDDAFARVKPLLECMGTTIHHCGAVGHGMRTKLINNFLAIVSCQMNAEAIALSQRFGLSLETTLNVIHGTTATNGQLKIAWASKVFTGDIEPGFTIDLAHKDLSLIVEAAHHAKVPVPIAAVAREAYTLARAQGHGGKDFSAMVDVVCDLADIEKPRFSATNKS